MAQIAVAAGADAIGLVIGVPRSPRTLTLSQAATIAVPLPDESWSSRSSRTPPWH